MQKVKIIWAKAKDVILDETTEQLVIIRNGQVHVGALMFPIDPWELVWEFVESSTVPDRAEKVLTTAYDYMCRYGRKHKDTLKTMTHWAFENRVIDEPITDCYTCKDDEELLVKLSEGSVW